MEKNNFKRFLSLLLAIVMLFTCIPFNAMDAFAAEEEPETQSENIEQLAEEETEPDAEASTEDTPDEDLQAAAETPAVEISSVEDLLAFAAAVTGNTEYKGVKVAANPAAVVLLTADLDLANSGFAPIGNGAANAFSGTFDGQGHIISNMTLSCDYYRGVGFFRSLGKGAVVKNVTFVNADVSNGAATASNHFYGVVAGFSNNLTLDNVDVKDSTVTCKYSGAVLVGCLEGATVIKNSDIENVTITTNDIRAAVYGIIGNSASGHKITVENNTVKDTKLSINGEIKPLAETVGYGSWNAGQVYAESTYVAQIGEKKYSTLFDAIKAAQASDTITLIGEVNGTVVIEKSVTIDVAEVSTQNIKFQLAEGGTLTAPEGLTITTNVEGYEVVYANGVYSVVEEKADVAMVGEIGYASLQDAINACKNGETVKLLADITYGNADVVNAVGGATGFGQYPNPCIIYVGGTAGTPNIPSSVNAVIDLNGHTLKNTADAYFFMIMDNATVTFTDSVGGGKVITTADAPAVWVIGTETLVTIKDGYFETASAGGVLHSTHGGDLVIEGGEFNTTAADKSLLVMLNSKDRQNSKFFISGVATVTIKGGIFHGFNPSKVGDDNGATSIEEIKFVDGCAEGYIPVKKADDIFGVKQGSYKVSVNGVKFETLAEAIKAATAGDTITFLADITENVTVNKAVTIDGQGHTLSGTVTIAADQGEEKLTFKNAVFETANTNSIYVGATSYNVTFDACVFKGAGSYAFEIPAGTSAHNFRFINECEVNMSGNFMQIYGTASDMLVDGMHIVSCGNAFKVNKNQNAITFNEVVVDDAYIFIYGMGYSDMSFVIKNCDITASFPFVRQDRAVMTYTYNFTGKNTIVAKADDSSAPVTATEYDGLYCVNGYNLGSTVIWNVYVAQIGETGYTTLPEALDAAADKYVDKPLTVELLTNVTVNGAVIIPTGVILDLGSNTLTANYVIGVKGSFLTADPNAGKLSLVSMDNLVLSEKAYQYADQTDTDADAMYVLPVWNDEKEYYLFTDVVVNTNNSDRGLFIDEDADKLYFQFKHQATGDINKGLISDSASASGLSMVVRFEWATDDGVAYQTFTYSDDQVKDVVNANDYTLTLKGYSKLAINMDNLKVYGMVVSSSGAVATGTAWTTTMDKNV